MGPAMSRPPPRPTAYGLLVAATALLLLALGAGLASQVGRPYPGFFADFDHTILLQSPAARAAGLRDNDHIVGVDGGSPLILRAPRLVLGAPVRYAVERAGSLHRRGGARAYHQAVARRDFRRVFPRLRPDAGGRDPGVPAESRRAAQPISKESRRGESGGHFEAPADGIDCPPCRP